MYFKDSTTKPVFFQANSKADATEWKVDLEVRFNLNLLTSFLQKVIQAINTPKEDNRIHLEAFNDPVVLSDERAMIIDLNEPAIELFGYTKEEAIGQNVTIFIPDALAARHEAFVTEYTKTSKWI